MFDWVENRLQNKSLKYWVFKLNRENTQPEDMCDIIFEKRKCVYAVATVQGVLSKGILRNFA